MTNSKAGKGREGDAETFTFNRILITRIQMAVGDMLRHVNRKIIYSEKEEHSIEEKLGKHYLTVLTL